MSQLVNSSLQQTSTMTRSLLLLTAILSALPVPSYSLTCIQCKDLNQQHCTGQPISCPDPDQICMSLLSVTKAAGMTISSFFMRECGNPKACNLAGSITMPHGRVLTSSTCCSTDKCTPKTPSLAAESDGLNGVSCMACMSTTKLPCHSDQYIDCIGKETKCYSQIQKTRGASGSAAAALRGCSTPEMCLVPKTETALGDSVITAEVTCQDGCSAIHHSLFLIVLCMSVITKLIY